MRLVKSFFAFVLLFSIALQAVPGHAQQSVETHIRLAESPNPGYQDLLQQSRGTAGDYIFRNAFGTDAEKAVLEMDRSGEELLTALAARSGERSSEWLDQQIGERKERSKTRPVVSPAAPTRAPAKSAPRPKRRSAIDLISLDGRQVAFGFQPLTREADVPQIKMTETDKEIKAEGSDRKTFETKDAKGTRTRKAETKYTKDGKVFGMEIRSNETIEAVSKPDGKSFRQEISIVWGAGVAACPDVNGISAGTGKAHVISKTTYTENGSTVTMTSEFDIRAKLAGQVNDEAEIKAYDMQIETTTTNSGYERALEQGLIKEIKLKDGTYELDFDVPGNTLEISDGTYQGKRTPAKMGNPAGRKFTDMPEADAKKLGSAVGPMVPSIWNSANEMHKTAERSWKNYGCVEVVSKAPKTKLKPGEEISISTEAIHKQDKSLVHGRFEAGGYPAQVTPETQQGKPSAVFTFVNEADKEKTTFYVKSISKRGIGEGEIEFQIESEEKPTEPGLWTGTIKAERKQKEERDKRSGANLAENGGYIETTTSVQLKVTGQLDRSVDANNAYIADVSGVQETIDHEYDRYKLDEGHCGPNAVPYKGPKEITRTSATTANYKKQTRAYLEIGPGGGTITFSLPEINGITIHKYVHKSPCAEHDRANTNEARDEEAATVGGSFSFSFPVATGQKLLKGTLTVRDESGATTTYSWELTRQY